MILVHEKTNFDRDQILRAEKKVEIDDDYSLDDEHTIRWINLRQFKSIEEHFFEEVNSMY